VTYIRNWYEAKKGNSNGLPVVHCSVNIVPQDFVQPQVEDFMNELGIDLCANDYNAKLPLGPLQTNAVHDLFQRQYLKPVFLVINCVSNSLSHPVWSLLVNDAGGQADMGSAISRWRTIIDSVQAPLPQLTSVSLADGTFQFTFLGQRGRTNRIECATDFTSWTVLTNVFGTNAPVTFRDTNPSLNGQRFYRVRRLE
jgi:hypothetical protein